MAARTSERPVPDEFPAPLAWQRRSTAAGTGGTGTRTSLGKAGTLQSVSKLRVNPRRMNGCRSCQQEEFGYSQLRTDNHGFLHGRPTNIPGSWQQGRAACSTGACQDQRSQHCSSRRMRCTTIPALMVMAIPCEYTRSISTRSMQSWRCSALVGLNFQHLTTR